MVSLKGITLSFGEEKFFDNFSVEFPEGISAVVGQSGAGKTNLARIISGTVTIDSGEVFIGGKESGDIPPKLRNIALISQQTPLRFSTVMKNLLYPFKLRKIRPPQTFDLPAEITNKKIKELSDAQKAEVFFCRAVARHPQLIIVDEPSAFLGQEGADVLMEKIKNCGRDVIWFTSSFAEAARLGGEILILRKGEIIARGSPQQLIALPPNSYVALMTGANIIDGKAVRPEAFFKGENEITVTVESFEKLENGYYLYCKHDGLPIKVFSRELITGTARLKYE